MPLDLTRAAAAIEPDEQQRDLVMVNEVEMRRVEELTEFHWQEWERIRERTPWLDSPFIAPEFVRVAAGSFHALRIAILKSSSRVVGFWPFEHQNHNGQQIASMIVELSGIVAGSNVHLDAKSILSTMGLRRWKFDCVPASDARLVPYFVSKQSSHYSDLSFGFEHLKRVLESDGCRQFSENRRKWRSLERDHGTVEWIWSDSRSSTLDFLLKWKRSQYRRTGAKDVLGFPWVQSLLRRVHECPSPDFHGVLSALVVQNQPIAIHFGLWNRNVFASWFPCYSPEFASYSPGRMLFIQLLEEAAARGIRRFDYGQGAERYKLSLATGSFQVGEGVVCQNRLDRLRLAAWIRAREFAQRRSWCLMPLRWFRHMRNRLLDGSSS